MPQNGIIKNEGAKVIKVMIFIDGTWLYVNHARLSEASGQPDYRIDYGKLPGVLAAEVGRQLGTDRLDVVRTHLFGSNAANHDLKDDDLVQRRRDFFEMLKDEYRYELEIFPINFRGRRIRRADRDAADPFEPEEKCVDIALATAMLFYAAVPHAYDIAISVVGDKDFQPVFQSVRRLGKRVAIASIKGSCAPEFTDPRDEARVRDFDIIWLDQLLGPLALKYEPHPLPCESPTHKGDRIVWTTFRQRRGQKFYCNDCKEEFARQKLEAHQEFVGAPAETPTSADSPEEPRASPRLPGVVVKKLPDRGYGFIETPDGRNYFFHLTDLSGGLGFDDVVEGLPVTFEAKKEPAHGKAGAAQNVLRRSADTSREGTGAG